MDFSLFLTVCWLYNNVRGKREGRRRDYIHPRNESIVGSQISAVCAISFELFFSVTQELINFSLFNPPVPIPLCGTTLPPHRLLPLYYLFFWKCIDWQEGTETKGGMRPVNTDETKAYFGCGKRESKKKSLHVNPLRGEIKYLNISVTFILSILLNLSSRER